MVKIPTVKAKKPRPIIPTEHEEQVAFLKWFSLQWPHIRYFSIPSGFWSKNIGMIRKLKREGMQAGIPDLLFPELNLFVEMKRSKGGVTSPEQKDWIHYLTDRCNYEVIVAHGCDDAVKKVLEYLKKLSNT